MKLIPIYIDEAGFTNENNNFYCWRMGEQEIYSDFHKVEKFNLLMAVTPNKIINFSMKDKSVDSSYFKKFMEDLIQNIGVNNINNYIFILDNASIHLTNELFEFYHKWKMKILFGIPYMSCFNMIEYAFRFIKNIIYKKLYPDTNSMKEDLIKILKGNNLIDTLPKLYRETLNKYLFYIKENSSKNLNL